MCLSKSNKVQGGKGRRGSRRFTPRRPQIGWSGSSGSTVLTALLIYTHCLFADQILSNTDFSNQCCWNTYKQQEVMEADVAIEDGTLRVSVRQSGYLDHHLCIYQNELTFVRDSSYVVQIRAKSSKPQELVFGFLKLTTQPWKVLATSAVSLDTGWRTYELVWPAEGAWLPKTTTCAFAIMPGRCEGIVELANVSIDKRVRHAEDYDGFACPENCRRQDPIRGHPADLPAGFFLFAYHPDAIGGGNVLDSGKGLFHSPLQEFDPTLVPGTEDDRPYRLSLSTDGRWVAYIDRATMRGIVISSSGSCKAVIPTEDYPSEVGFWRSSPLGDCVIYYSLPPVGSRESMEIRAIVLTLEDGRPTFQPSRLVARMPKDTMIAPWNFALAKDGIIGRIERLEGGRRVGTTGFVTIPDGGLGVAECDDVYSWDGGDGGGLSGCAHNVSHDGNLWVANTGDLGFAGGYNHCAPRNHKGFYITPFRGLYDPPIDVHDHMHKGALSVNWCPIEYRFGGADDIDFSGWAFAGNSDYMIGTQAGPRSPWQGLWVIEWKENRWTPVTPVSDTICALKAALYVGNYIPDFSTTDTCPPLSPPDTNDTPGPPQLLVVKPNGGERYSVGAKCTVIVTANRPVAATASIHIGRYSIGLPGLTTSFDPLVDSVHTFTIPTSFEVQSYNYSTGKVETKHISTVSDECIVSARPYQPGAAVEDYSDGAFSIYSDTLMRIFHNRSDESASCLLKPHAKACRIGSYNATLLVPPGVSRVVSTTIRGRKVYEWTGSPSSTIRRVEMNLPGTNAQGIY
ncbi:MAG: hypothetical protein GF344_12740, partial [Chitinivibrionales bacterium]|nr:hypothetical protein [Chitinivibrionales bacterium]MBD3357610.1 hypothetical protein [Chitinivibrionales bacterium]